MRRPELPEEVTELLPRDELPELFRAVAERFGFKPSELRWIEASPTHIVLWPVKRDPIRVQIVAPPDEELGFTADWRPDYDPFSDPGFDPGNPPLRP